ncbi:hypothetical protein ACFX5Q_22550 [Mesorhizobium sp. IMUNJ 23033]
MMRPCRVDEELARVTVQVLGRVTVDAGTVELVKKYHRPKSTTLMIDESA